MDVTTMISDLGDHGFADTSTSTKVRMLQDAIWKIEAHRAWPFLEASIDLNFDGSNDVPSNLPTDIKAIRRAKDLSAGKRVLPIRVDELEDRIGNDYSLAGSPLFYYFEGGQLKFWPIPGAATGLVRLKYIKRSAEITSSSVESAILIPKQHHRVIVTGALMALYDMEDDTELAVRYQQYFEDGLARMVDELFHQQYDQPDHVVVTDPDDWDFDVL